MKFTLGFSPCPNDTFIFDALVNNKIDTGDFEFEVVLEDVQTLNQWAIDGRLDVSKISYGVLPLVLNKYKVLDSGSALGKGVGPLLISKSADEKFKSGFDDVLVAIPGENTTANMLFCMAYPAAKNKRFVVFNEVEDLVLSGEVDAGVIIHENRFTYQDKGLIKLIDLGEYWEEKKQLPIPLGGIVVKRHLDLVVQQQINQLIRSSLEYAFSNYPHLSDYVIKHSQEMEESVMRQHIDLYVNNFSLSLGEEGKNAINALLYVVDASPQHNVFVY